MKSDRIPDDISYRELTLNELISEAEGCTVTCMAISGDNIPPLHVVAPGLKRLRLSDVSNIDERCVRS